MVNAIYTAVRLGVLDDAVLEDAEAIAATPFGLGNSTDELYTVTGKDWEFSTDYATGGSGANKLLLEIKEVVGEFRLKSSAANDNTTIEVTVDGTDNITVTLDYDGVSSTTDDIYTASDSAVRP